MKMEKRCKDFVSNGYPHRHTFKKLCRQMIQEFDQIETLDVKNQESESLEKSL